MIEQGRPVEGGKPKSVLVAVPGDQSWLLPDKDGNVKVTVNGATMTLPKADPQAQCTKAGV